MEVIKRNIEELQEQNEYERLNALAEKQRAEIAEKELARLKNRIKKNAYDLIVSNPPYISWKEEINFPKDVREYEPHQALFADQDGAGVVDQIFEFSMEFMADHGLLAKH